MDTQMLDRLHIQICNPESLTAGHHGGHHVWLAANGSKTLGSIMIMEGTHERTERGPPRISVGMVI